MTRAEILAVARSQMGVPWQHQAHRLGVGLDCLGFFVATAAQCGSDEARTVMADAGFWNYGREPNPSALIAACDARMDVIARSEARAADVLLLRAPKWPMHFGFLGDGEPATLIHASLPHRRVVEHRLDDGWRGRIVRAWRIRGVE